MVAVFLIMAAVSMWVAFRRRKEKKSRVARLRDSQLWGTILRLSVFDALLIAFFVVVGCSYEVHWYAKLGYILLGLLTEGLLVSLMAGWMTARRFLAWCACTVLIIGGLYSSYRYDQHLRDITLPDSFYYGTYRPFSQGSLVKVLEETSTLHYSDPDALLRMDGATALYPVYAAFAQATYPTSLAEMKAKELDALVACSTTTSAYRNIVDGVCDIIFVAGPSEEQEAYAAEKGVELVYTPIGREAFVFFVHPENPVEGLTLQEIRSIYAGEITSWDELGVQGLGAILAYQRDEGSGSQTALKRFVMRDTPLMPADMETHVGSMGGIVQQVSAYKNHRNAIGYSFRFYCTALMKNFDVKLLAVDGIAPTVENIENGTYPLASNFYAVTRADADADTLALVEWVCGPQGQALVEKTGYTPLPSSAE